jgi:hypothetical protein
MVEWVRKLGVRRGYIGPTVGIFVFGICLTAVLVDFSGLLSARSWDDLFSIAASPIFVVLACALVVALLPRRTLHGGPRRSRINLRLISRVALFGAIVTLLAGCTLWDALRNILPGWLGIPASLFSFSRLLSKVADRQDWTIVLEQNADRDIRPPVIYLRPFGRESEYFSQAEAEGLDYWKNSLSFAYNQDRVYPTFDQFVESSVNGRLGPFRALGDPRNYLPPLGATRTYLSENWQEEVCALIDRAGCILTVVAPVGESVGYTFEFAYMLRSGATNRLFVVTSPYGSSRRPPLRMRLFNRLHGIKPAKWDEFAASLSNLGYELPIDRPGPGTVLTFDRQGRATVVTTGARTSEEYIVPIVKRLALPSA